MDYEEYWSAFGYYTLPSGSINRKYTNRETTSWFYYTSTELAVDPPAHIMVSTSYNENTRELEAVVSAEFIESLNGDYRLGGVLVEDGVTGPSPLFDQDNSYSAGSNGPMGGFENLPFMVPAYMIAYDYVARYLFGGYNGQEGSLPPNPISGQTYSWTFTYTLHEEYNAEYVRIVGWLIDQNTGHILNAGRSIYLPGFSNGKPQFLSSPETQGFVGTAYVYSVYTADPEDDNLIIMPTDIPQWMSFTPTAQNTVHTAGILSGIPDVPGNYTITLSVSDGEWTIDQTFNLNVEFTNRAWVLVGDEGFTNNSDNDHVLKIASDGTPYIAAALLFDSLVVFSFNGDDWVKVGKALSTTTYTIDMELDSEDLPWVVYRDNLADVGTTVKKFNGTSWEKIGGNVGESFPKNLEIVFDNCETPFIGFVDGDDPLYGYVFKLIENEWTVLGNGAVSQQSLNDLKLAFDQENSLYALVNSYSSTKVLKFENNTWSLVGNGNVTNQNAEQPDIIFDNQDNLFVSLSETFSGKIIVCRFDGIGWENITEDYDFSGGLSNLVHDTNNKLYLGYRNSQHAYQTSVIRWNGSNWTPVGPVTISGPSENHKLAIAPDNTPYIAYTDWEHEHGITVKAYALFGSPHILTDPQNFVYDTTIVGQISEHVFMVSNIGGETLVITDINSNNLVFIPSPGNFSLEPEESMQLTITFAPTREMWYEGEITIQSNDPATSSLIIGVSGYGLTDLGEVEKEEGHFILYPNPANGFLFINAATEIQKIKIFNNHGELIRTEIPISNDFRMNVTSFVSGIYFFAIETTDAVTIMKVLVH